MKSFATLPVAALLTLVNGTPTPTRAEKRADSCGQWDTVQTGSYTVYNNLWGQDAATSGGQCFGVDGLEGNTISWHASWDWVGGQGRELVLHPSSL